MRVKNSYEYRGIVQIQLHDFFNCLGVSVAIPVLVALTAVAFGWV